MSQRFDTTDYIERTANLPTRTTFTIGGWFKLPASAPGSIGYLFEIATGGFSIDIASLRWRNDLNSFRFGNNNNVANLASNPAWDQWIYWFMRNDATNLTCGWKTIADSSFYTESVGEVGSGSISVVRVGGNPFGNAMDFDLFRLSMWNEPVLNADLLLAAATDLGYITNLNTHLPLSSGIGSPWNDTSGNGYNWTNSGSFSDQADPTFGGSGQSHPISGKFGALLRGKLG